MARLLVQGFSISLDGYGAGPRQSRESPLGVGGEDLHDWLVHTRTFKRLHDENRAEGEAGACQLKDEPRERDVAEKIAEQRQSRGDPELAKWAG